MKTCSKCGVPKEEPEFYLVAGKAIAACKTCTCLAESNRRKRDPEKARSAAKARRLKDLEKARRLGRERNKKSRQKNPNSRREEYSRCREEKIKSAREWVLENPERRKENALRWYHESYRDNPEFHILQCLRSRLGSAIRQAKANKTCRTMALLGCPWVWLEVHLESLFKPGMTWANHGPVWHIDHIKPCAAFDLMDSEQQKACFHWTNLQPLFVRDNLKKGAKV